MAKNTIKYILGIHQEGGTGTYLGLPEGFGGLKQDLFAFIGDRLKKRLHRWYSQTFSLRGKEILLNRWLWAYALSGVRNIKF